jgi:hypothetical protein
MERWMWKAALAGMATLMCLVLASWAQEDPMPSCEEVCYEAEERCYQACDSAEAIEACEEDCGLHLEACLEQSV